jgi:hypothetical protein
MKATKYFLTLLVTLTWITSSAQHVNFWDYGLSANVGFEHLKVITTIIASRNENSSNSDFAVSGGFWAERHLGRRFSAVINLNYSAVKVGYNIFTGGLSKASHGDVMEKHGYISIIERGRLYFAEKARRKWFFDMGLKLDRMIYFKNSYIKGGVTVWNPKDFGRLNPGLVAGFGIAKGRWRLSAEYQYSLGTSLSKRYRENLEYQSVNWDVNRQNISLGAAFMLSRLK